ncbi:MAG: hypothetical protein ACRDIB_06955, partial [Ardenticatenaceae bacterium]
VFLFLKGFAHRAPVGFSMGMWQMARNPTHYARLSLLLILMAGLGIFAASFGGTLERSFEERALYFSGTNLRLDGVLLNTRGSTVPFAESYESLPGVDSVSPVVRRFGTDLSRLLGEQYMMLSVDSDVFAEMAYFREDFASKPLGEMLGGLKHSNLPQGIEMPDNSFGIGVTLKSDRPQPSVAMTARIRDANGRYFTYFLGTLDSADWVNLSTPIRRQPQFGQPPLQPVPPLTLMSVALHELNGSSSLRSGSVIIDEVYARTNGGDTHVMESFEDVGEWNLLRVAPESVADVLESSDITANGDSGSARFIWASGGALTSRGIFHGPPIEPLPVLATRTFLRDTGHSVG